jgi:hypothetical protein
MSAPRKLAANTHKVGNDSMPGTTGLARPHPQLDHGGDALVGDDPTASYPNAPGEECP